MLTLRLRILFTLLAISALLISGLAGLTFGQVTTQVCESCGMSVAADCQAHLKVVDSNGTLHYAECFRCAIKLLKIYGELNITTNCDWYGPSQTITVYLKDKVNTTIVNPTSALFIDGGCTKNRIIYDQTAADNLLANNGTSPYLTKIQNVTIPANATVMTIAQAAKLYAFTSSPDPTPTPTPTASPTTSPLATPALSPSLTPSETPVATPTAKPSSSPLVTQTCEACAMEVPPDAQSKYIITDGTGTVHFAECYMCALHLINKYDSLNIITYCDWYGPNYTITVTSLQYGKEVTVTPSTALFLNGGSCVINRAAYNQTAADSLLSNGYSKYTLPEQHYDLPSNTEVSGVVQAALVFNQNAITQNPQAIPFPLIMGAIAGAAIIVLSIVAYFKINSKKP